MQTETKAEGVRLENLDLDNREKARDAQEVEILRLGAEVTLLEGRSPWRVLFENPKVVLLILIVQFNSVVVGMEYSLPGNVLGINAFLKLFGVPTGTGSYNVPAGTLTLWAAMFALFQMFGQAFGGWQSDYFGRRFCLYSVVFWTYLGVTLEIISQNWRMWTGAKIVIGFATGVMQSVVPTYVAEVAPRECRAINLGLCHLTAVFGALISTLVTYGTNTKWGANIDDQRAFRVPLYIGLAVPTLCAFFELFILVESPWWLLMKGKREQARKSLEYLYSWQKSVDIDAKFAELEYTLRKEAEAKELQKQSSYLECFKGVDLRRSFVAAFPQASSNLAGNNLNGQYATYFFQIAGSENPLVNSVVTIVVGMASNVIAFFFIEDKRIGRRPLLLFGIITMTLCMLGIAITAEVTNGVYTHAGGVLLTLFVALFATANSIGPGVAGYAYVGESGSSRLRAKTTTLGVLGAATIGLIMTSALPWMLNARSAGGQGWGVKTAWMFVVLGTISSVVTWLWIPEYAGRTYAQIDELFIRKVPTRKFKSFECSGEYGRDLDMTVPQ